MLAKLSRELPRGDGLTYEPKWDGFRCLVFRDGASVDLRSRNERPLARYFPELVEAFLELDEQQFVADGEIVVTGGAGLDFEALMARLHPAASRVQRLRAETPAAYVAFDLLAVGDQDCRDVAFAQRRQRMVDLFGSSHRRLFVTPATRNPEVASGWLRAFRGAGLDGVMAKPDDMPYTPGKRAMVKVKVQQTGECVVAGFRWHAKEPVVGSLLLGVYDGLVLHHVGVSASFTAAARRQLLDDVRPHVTGLEGHPWATGFPLSVSGVGRLPGAVSRWAVGRELTWVPLRPELVCEVAYDHLELDRFRHAPTFQRWRPDRDPRSCTFAQFREADPRAVASFLPSVS